MFLAPWTHPTSQVTRLYVNDFFTGPHASTKAWFEEMKRSPGSFRLKTSGDFDSLASTPAALQAIILDGLDLDENADWADLVAKAGTGKRKAKASSKTTAIGGWSKPAPATYTDRPSESLALDITSIKMIGPVTIHVDHREPPELAAILGQHELITVEANNALELGDILVEDREGNQLIIERKRCTDDGTKTDFEASIQVDGRLFDQSERLKLATASVERQTIPVVLLEGDVHRNAATMLCQQVDGAISFLTAVQRISVIPSYNLNHTAYIVAKLASHFVDGLFTPVSLHKQKPKMLFEQQRYVLESMPGISTKIAEALLAHFGSIRAFTNATEAELLAVPGLGKKKVAELIRVLYGGA